ncbi:uncharacterized protein LOC115452879 isoform X1 [Manduca sexta]|uniref:uncharacterized protein LOC115452879 isoform X1 n=1 Tax=Manduca sexta TaxID=7130 RepID=UPI00188FB6FA|nr:uncharacterized protein LOC115452879 isoform X1 [Manduca sexta]
MLFVCVVLVMFLEGTHEHFSSMDDIPLTKSLGYSLDKNFGKTLRDSRLSQEYIEQYQEMLKVSQESIESISNEHTKFRREGDGNFELVPSAFGRQQSEEERARKPPGGRNLIAKACSVIGNTLDK